MREVDYAQLMAREAAPDPTDSMYEADMEQYKRFCRRVLALGVKTWGDGTRVLDPDDPKDLDLIHKIRAPPPGPQPLRPIERIEATDGEDANAEPGGGALVRADETGEASGALVRADDTGEAGGGMGTAQEPARAATGGGGLAEVAARLKKALGATPVDEATALQALEELKNFESPDGKTLKKTGAPLPPPVVVLASPPCIS